MATLPFSDDLTEFEKLTNNLEFENKQYVKMIEKENQCIKSLQGQIEKYNEMMERVEMNLSKTDEETMRLHKQYVRHKETVKNLKDTYNVMMDHETALDKQLETLKIKTKEEQQYYQEQMTNYSKTRDEYMKKYQKFPLVDELNEKKEKLALQQRESAENDAIIEDLQQKIKEKEAVLDYKVSSRMIIKIAGLKLSTMKTEKELHECLVEKTTLLQQLKEIQNTKGPESQFEKEIQEQENEPRMECDENKTEEILETFQASEDGQYRIDKQSTIESFVDVLPQSNADEERDKLLSLCSDIEKQHIQEIPGKSNFVSDSVHSAENVEVAISNNLQQTVPMEVNQSTNSILPRKTSSSYLSGITSRVQSVPQIRPLQRSLPKLPTFKPIRTVKITPKETANVTQQIPTSASKFPTENSALQTAIKKLSAPPQSVPKISVRTGTIYSDSEGLLKTAAPSQISTKLSSVETAVRLSAPKPPAYTSTFRTFIPKIYTRPAMKPAPIPTPPRLLPPITKPLVSSISKSLQSSHTSSSIKDTQPISKVSSDESINRPFSSHDIDDAANKANLPFQWSHDAKQNKEKPQSLKLFEEDPDEEPSGFSVNVAAMDEPLFKPSRMGGSVQPNDKHRQLFKNVDKVHDNSDLKRKERFGLASVVGCNEEEGSQSPSAFTLFNFGSSDNDLEMPFVSFGGNSTDDGQNDNRPNSLLSLFGDGGSQSSQKSLKITDSNPEPAFHFGMHKDDGEDGGVSSIFNFSGPSESKSDEDTGFFNFGQSFGKEDCEKSETSFKLLF